MAACQIPAASRVVAFLQTWSPGRHNQATDHIGETDRAAPPVAEDKVYAGQVLAYVRTMPEREQLALFLVFSEGMTHREVAAVMECKESTVSWYIHEARKKLQTLQNLERRYG